MPGCPYFIANTFVHLLVGLLFTGISSENPLINNIDTKPLTNFALFLTSLPLLYFIFFINVGPIKYGATILLCVLLGQSLSGLAKHLKLADNLSTILISTGIIFTVMSIIGLLDKQNILGFEVYLSAALIALLFIYIISFFYKKEISLNTWISRFIILLFTFYIGFDIQVLKENAKACSNPDYINESINLYLNFVNLFTGFSN